MRISLLILLFCFSTSAFAQPARVTQSGGDSTICHVMQFFDEDSANAKEQLTIVYNHRGKVLSEKYIRFQRNCLFYWIGYSVRYYYTDTLLTEKIENEDQKAPIRFVYTHDEKGRVKTESKFKWIADPGATPVHRPGMPEEATTTVAGKWNQIGIATISYDDKGRKIAWDATRLHDKKENLEKWEYDDQNRISSHQIYSRGKLTCKTDYMYYEGGYRCWDINYDSEGSLSHELEEGQGYQPTSIHAYTFDKAGRIGTEKLSNEKGTLQCTIYYSYDKSGRLARTVIYDALSGITYHVYNYSR